MAEQTTLTPKKANGRPIGRDRFGMFDTLKEELDPLWHRPWAALPTMFNRPAGPPTLWAPRMDVYEKDGMLVVKAELPGVKKEDVSVELDNGTLIIKGETKAESDTTQESYYRMERTYGSYFRRLPLPFDVSPDELTATMVDGVLEIRMPKPAEAAPPATKINVT
jgi:HSP20 family protein